MAITLKDRVTGKVYTSDAKMEGLPSPSPVGTAALSVGFAASSPKGRAKELEAPKVSLSPQNKSRGSDVVRTRIAARSAANKERMEEKGIGRVQSLMSNVGRNTLGGVEGVGAMALNTAKDYDEAVDTEWNNAFLTEQQRIADTARRNIEMLLADGDYTESEMSSQRNILADAEAKIAAAEKAGEKRVHALDKPISTLTAGAKANVQKAAQHAEDAKEGLGAGGALAMEAALTVGNMLPAIGVSAVAGPGAGAAFLGATSGGRSYTEKLLAGSDEKKARAYGTIVGALEAGLSYAIGGISKLAGKRSLTSRLEAKIAAMESGVKKAAAYLALHGMSEIGEEEAQLFLEPLVNSIIYNEKYDAPSTEDVVYTALVTALSTGALELPGAIRTGSSAALELEAPGKEKTAPEGAAEAPKLLKTAEEMAGETAFGENAVELKKGPSAINERDEKNQLAYTLATNIGSIADMSPVKHLSGKELNDRSRSLSEQVVEFFHSLGNAVIRQGFGKVALNEYGIGGLLNHRPINRAKVLGLAAAPEVIKNGRLISSNENWKGRGYASYVFAAPVSIGGTTVYVAAVVDKRPDNKFYLSEMVDSDGNYVRIEESPSGNSKNGVTGGVGYTNGAGITAGPERLSKDGAPLETGVVSNPAPSIDSTIAHPSETVKTGEADTEPPRYLQTAEEMYPAAAHPPEDAEPTDTIEAPRYLPTAEEAAKAETSNELPAPLAEEDPYLAALALDENAPPARTKAERAAEMRWAQRLEDAESAAEEQRAEPIDKRDLDELAELIEATAELTATPSREEHLNASESLVRAETPKEHKTASEQLREAHGYFVRKMVDSGHSVTKAAKAAGDKYLYPFFNMARSSASAGANMIAGEQTDVTGKAVGKGLNDIFKPIRERGADYYKAFQIYMFDLHNIDRMSLSRRKGEALARAELALQTFDRNNPDVAALTESRLRSRAEKPVDSDSMAELARERLKLLREVEKADRIVDKPVFDYEVTADMSRERSARLLREHPEFAQYRDEVRKYIDNMMRYRVDSGLMTAKDAEFLREYYPNYVPTFRATEKKPSKKNRDAVRIGKTVGKAEGGTEILIPIHEALGKQTMSVVREGSKNRFGQRLLEDYLASDKESELRRYVTNAEEFEADFSADTFDRLDDPTPKRENTFSVYKDGKLWDMTVDDTMFDAVKALSPDAQKSNIAMKGVRAANKLFKGLVTGYNPTFLVRNTVRDLQTAGLYSRDGAAFLKNYPLALKEIKENGEYWRQYKALGGSFSSVFDYQTGTVKEPTGKAAKLAAKIEALNMAMEQAPRLAEFMSVVKAGDGSVENLMDAMHAAADVTVNFGRSGSLGKLLNANFVPFLNPGIQGFDKMIRRVSETQGAKAWTSLVIRAGLLGVAPSLLNALLYDDDDEWDDIRDSDKDTNYLFKIGEGKWLKVPKGRELSLLGMAADRAGDLARGESVDWGEFVTTAANQVAPANPLEQNIAKAWFDTDLFDSTSPGKTWYGGDIENQRLRNYAPGERYDSSTDVVSKWIGKQLGLSPKKINYLLDQYTGVVGDFVLPILTPQAERGMFEKAFTLDSVSNNRISGEFYDMSDELTYAKNGGDDIAAVVNRFWNKQSSACSDIYAEIRAIEESGLADAEKKQQVREAKAVLNGIQKNALALEETYREAAEKALKRERGDIDAAYREANRSCFGAEYALKVYNEDVHAKAQEAHAAGVGYEDYYEYYFATKGLKSDASSTKKEKVLAVIDAMDLTADQKDALYLAAGYSENTLDETPWYESEYEKYSLKAPGVKLPKLELPNIPVLELEAP